MKSRQNMQTFKNWAGNRKYHSTDYFEPQSTDEIIKIVNDSPKVKALGTRHCFNEIADTDGTHISLRKMNRLFSIDVETRCLRS